MTLEWTLTPPDKEGFYWYRYEMDEEPEVVEIDTIDGQPVTKLTGWDVWIAEYMGNQQGWYWPVRLEFDMQILSVLREYLSYASIDGKPERKILRAKLTEMLNNQ